MVSKSVVPHRLIRLFQLWVVLRMHNNELVLSSKKMQCSLKKQTKQQQQQKSQDFWKFIKACGAVGVRESGGHTVWLC